MSDTTKLESIELPMMELIKLCIMAGVDDSQLSKLALRKAKQTLDAAIAAHVAAHVAAEVAAERARCVVPEVVREAVDDGIHTLEAEAHKAEDMRRFEKAQSRRIAAAQCRAWLAALPPTTPEGT